MDDVTRNAYSADADLAQVKVDTTTLPGIITSGADLCIILTRRVDGKPYNKYYCNGESSKSTAHETWSSSKIFAMMNATGKLREQCA